MLGLMLNGYIGNGTGQFCTKIQSEKLQFIAYSAYKRHKSSSITKRPAVAGGDLASQKNR